MIEYTQLYNRTNVHSRLRLRCATHGVYLLIFIVEQNLVEIYQEVSALTSTPLRNTHDTIQSTV